MSLAQRGYNHFLPKIPALLKYLSPALLSVNMELTNNCNLRCKMCFSHKRKKGFMTFDLFRKIVDELKPNVSLGLTLAGEATLHPLFVEFLRYIRNKKFKKTALTTNGTLLNHDLIREILDSVDDVCISLDGVGKVNDDIRLGCNYEQVSANILEIMRLKHTRNTIYVNMTVSTQTQEDIDLFVKTWKGKVDYVRIKPAYTEDLRLNDGFASRKGLGYCDFPMNFMGVLWNGDIVACCNDWNGRNIMGNVTSKGIYDVWNSHKYRMFRHKLLTNTLDKESLCYGCSAWKTKDQFIEVEETVKPNLLKIDMLKGTAYHKRTICEVIRETYAVIYDSSLTEEEKQSLFEKLSTAYVMAKKMTNKLYEYKYDMEKGPFFDVNTDYSKDLKERAELARKLKKEINGV